MNGRKAIMAALALAFLVAGGAGAQGWGGHGRGGGGDRGGGERGGDRGEGRGGGRDLGGGGWRGGGYGRGPDGGFPGQGRGGQVNPRFYGPPPESFGRQGYAPPAYYTSRPAPDGYPYARGGGGSWRRGDFLPRPFWGGAALDTRRYHLRSAPPGYGWYAIGREGYLVQRSTGLILDTAPGLQ